MSSPKRSHLGPRSLSILLATLVAAGGCASVSATGPRSEVNELMSQRLGVENALTPEQDEDARTRVRERVDALLASPLGRDNALELALINNHALAAQLEALGIAQAELVEAGLLENPTIGGDVIISTLGNGYGGGFAAATSLLSAFMIPAKRKIAKARLKQTILSVGRSAAELAETVKLAYVHAQVAQADRDLHRQALQAAEVLDELARRQYEAGNIPEGERADAGAHLDEARLEFGHARMEAMMAREELTVLFGLWGKDLGWKLPTKIDAPPAALPDLQGLETRAINERLDLSAARFDVEAAMQAIKLRRAGIIPAIEIGVEGGNEVGNDVGHEWVLGPSLSIELPIFNPGHADFAALRAHLRAAEHRLQQLAVEVRSDVRLHRQHLVYAHEKVAYVKDVLLPRREMMLERKMERYNAMLTSAEELFDAKVELLEAKSQLNEALADYWAASAELELAIGGRLAPGAAQG